MEDIDTWRCNLAEMLDAVLKPLRLGALAALVTLARASARAASG